MVEISFDTYGELGYCQDDRCDAYAMARIDEGRFCEICVESRVPYGTTIRYIEDGEIADEFTT